MILYTYLLNETDAESATRIVYFVYNSSHINRFFVEDYLDFMNMSKFDVNDVTGYGFTAVPPEIQSRLESSYPGRNNFCNNGILAVLQRPL